MLAVRCNPQDIYTIGKVNKQNKNKNAVELTCFLLGNENLFLTSSSIFWAFSGAKTDNDDDFSSVDLGDTALSMASHPILSEATAALSGFL